MKVREDLRAAVSMYWRMLSEANCLKTDSSNHQTDEQIDELEILVIHSEFPFLAVRARAAISFLQPVVLEEAVVGEASA